jgi:hypothetical protein
MKNDKFQNLYTSTHINAMKLMKMRSGGLYGRAENAYNFLGKKFQGKRPLGRPTH